MQQHERFSKILALLSDAVTELSDKDFDKLAAGTHSVKLRLTPKPKRTNPKSTSKSISLDFTDTIKMLESSNDRLVAIKHLKSAAPNKKSLMTIARQLDIAVSNRDRIADLRNRIVESTIGARLCSAAILGYKSS